MRNSFSTPDRWRRTEELFHAALEQLPDDRSAFLTRMCGEDGELRDEVRRLLVNHAEVDGFIEPPPMAPAASARRLKVANSPAGGKIGSFEIVRVIASGGMGTVYEAIQQHPRRTVALKVLRFGAASPAALRRFSHEAVVLGRLRHAGIAQVFEAGTHLDGEDNVPYFAMEHIPDATSIVDFAKAANLDVRAKLELFAKVCDAVHHGHQHGIIHRDLKPANILVDASGQPKVIDFGVARVVDSEMTVTTMQTGVGQLIGTLVYMSPEQCAGDPDAVDTRSDVYSLGVVLYELLCGPLPYDVRNRPIAEAARVIENDPPQRPSSHLSALRGDIETILLTALDKDRDRRYQSASDLAGDIRRFLGNEPILARPPSFSYTIRLFTRRHVAAVVAGAAVLLILLAAVIVSTTFAIRATHSARGESDARMRAERVTHFLQNMISSAGPFKKGRSVTVLEMLEEAAAKVDAELIDQPEAEAGIRFTIGDTYAALWMWPEAIPHLRRALKLNRELHGADHSAVADSLGTLGRALTFRNDPSSITMQTEALTIRRKLYGENDARVAESLGNLAFALWASSAMPQWKDAEKRYRQSLAMYHELPGDHDHEIARVTYGLGAMCSAEGRFQEAENLFREALALYRSPKTPDVGGDVYPAEMLSDFASLMQRMGRIDEAKSLLRESLELRPEGAADTRALDVAWRLGAMHHDVYEFAEAERAYAQSLAVRCRWLAHEFPDRAEELRTLAEQLTSIDNGEFDPPYNEVFAMMRTLQSPNDYDLFRYLHDLADVLQHTGPARGARLLRSGVKLARKFLSPNHWACADMESILGGCLTSMGEYEEAEPLLLSSYPPLRFAPVREQRQKEALARIVAFYEAVHRPDRAEIYRGMMGGGIVSPSSFRESPPNDLGMNSTTDESGSPCPATWIPRITRNDGVGLWAKT